MGIARVTKCNETVILLLGNTFLYSTVRSASRLIKNLPVPLGTLVRKIVRLKLAASLHHIVHLIRPGLVLMYSKDGAGQRSMAGFFLLMCLCYGLYHL